MGSATYRSPRSTPALRGDVSGLCCWLPYSGFVSLTVLLVAQLQTLGTTSYYFLKYLLGFELILAALIPAVVGMLLAAITVAAPATRVRRGAWSVVATLVATQCFGHLTLQGSLLFSETDDGTAAIAPPYSRAGIARGVIAATSASSPAASFDREYVAVRGRQGAPSVLPRRVVSRRERDLEQRRQ